MDDIYTIEDGRIGGRPGPTRVAWDLAAIKEAGFTVIVSFECDRLDPGEIRAARIEHKMICVDDFTAPTLDQLYEFNRFVDRKLKEGKKVLTHCYAGRGRTGTFLASRLIWRGGRSRNPSGRSARGSSPRKGRWREQSRPSSWGRFTSSHAS